MFFSFIFGSNLPLALLPPPLPHITIVLLFLMLGRHSKHLYHHVMDSSACYESARSLSWVQALA